MEFRLLNTFAAVARLNSFTKAAEQLGYAQSSVTSQVQALESELGSRLFERLGKSVSLTPEGEKLLPYATQIIRLSQQAKNAIAAQGAVKGALSIGALESLCAVRLMPLFTEYHRRYPDVEISLKFGGFDLIDMLRDNQIDITFFMDKNAKMQDLVTVLEWLEPIVLLAPPGHPLSRLKSVEPTDLAGQTLILTEAGCCYRNRLLKILGEAGVAPRSILESGSVQMMKQLAASGLGVTQLPRVAALEELAGGQLAELQWTGRSLEMMSQLIHHRDKWVSPAMEAFIAMARELMYDILKE